MGLTQFWIIANKDNIKLFGVPEEYGGEQLEPAKAQFRTDVVRRNFRYLVRRTNKNLVCDGQSTQFYQVIKTTDNWVNQQGWDFYVALVENLNGVFDEHRNAS